MAGNWIVNRIVMIRYLIEMAINWIVNWIVMDSYLIDKATFNGKSRHLSLHTGCDLRGGLVCKARRLCVPLNIRPSSRQWSLLHERVGVGVPGGLRRPITRAHVAALKRDSK